MAEIEDLNNIWERQGYSFADFFRTVAISPTSPGMASSNQNQRLDNKMDLTRIEYGTGASIEQLIMAEAYMQVVADRIKANGHEVPDTLTNALDKCSVDLRVKLDGDRRRKLAALRLKREQLLSADEKRGKVEREISELEAILAKK